jgi:hypothetical protein
VNSSTTLPQPSAPPSNQQDPLALFRELAKVTLPIDPSEPPEDKLAQDNNQA